MKVTTAFGTYREIHPWTRQEWFTNNIIEWVRLMKNIVRMAHLTEYS